MFEAIGFVIRLPFFLLGFIVITFIQGPFTLIVIIIGAPVWFLYALLSGLLSNDEYQFRRSISDLWRNVIEGGITDFLEAYQGFP